MTLEQAEIQYLSNISEQKASELFILANKYPQVIAYFPKRYHRSGILKGQLISPNKNFVATIMNHEVKSIYKQWFEDTCMKN